MLCEAGRKGAFPLVRRSQCAAPQGIAGYFVVLQTGSTEKNAKGDFLGGYLISIIYPVTLEFFVLNTFLWGETKC